MQTGAIRKTLDTDPELTRSLRTLRDIATDFAVANMKPLDLCQAIVENRIIDSRIREFFLALPEDDKQYWVSSLYAALMPPSRRRRLATHFTPPYLARYLIDLAIDTGVELGKDHILDPASGGAAFLVPLSIRITRELRQRGSNSEVISRIIESTLAGIEIEPNLVRLSHMLLENSLRSQFSGNQRIPCIPIQRANALKLTSLHRPFDAIIGNPPYGRIYRPSRLLLSHFDVVIRDGYVNLYALFIEQALRWVRPGGIICFIVPMSFVGGPYFAALRKRILETCVVLRLDPIDKRGNVFLDVHYDICVLTLRKKDGNHPIISATSSLLLMSGPPRPLGQLDLPPSPSERIWALPDGKLNDRLFQNGLKTLSDYGYIVRAGYFVWNREKKRYRIDSKPRPSEVPLYWARNIIPNGICEPHILDQSAGRFGFVYIDRNSPAIVHTDAIALQRTSNRRQKRRLVAGLILRHKVPGNKGFVTENHTILIVPDPLQPQQFPMHLLCRLLNTEAVDARFRRISGSVSISVRALRELPLPDMASVRSAFQPPAKDEEAAATAYMTSLDHDDERGTEFVTNGLQKGD